MTLYCSYYERSRTHLSLDKDTPIPRPVTSPGMVLPSSRSRKSVACIIATNGARPEHLSPLPARRARTAHTDCQARCCWRASTPSPDLVPTLDFARGDISVLHRHNELTGDERLDPRANVRIGRQIEFLVGTGRRSGHGPSPTDHTHRGLDCQSGAPQESRRTSTVSTHAKYRRHRTSHLLGFSYRCLCPHATRREGNCWEAYDRFCCIDGTR
jgi:hypothetical protein